MLIIACISRVGRKLNLVFWHLKMLSWNRKETLRRHEVPETRNKEKLICSLLLYHCRHVPSLTKLINWLDLRYILVHSPFISKNLQGTLHLMSVLFLDQCRFFSCGRSVRVEEVVGQLQRQKELTGEKDYELGNAS